MNKRLLILTDEIAPPAFAPRVVSLCHHLHQNGWECVVCSDRLPDVPAYSNSDATWHQMAYYGERQTMGKYIADKLFGRRERLFRRFVEQRVDVGRFDAIVCSSCYYFPLQTADYLAGKYHLPCLIDLRDIAEQWGNMPYATGKIALSPSLYRRAGKAYEHIHLRRRNRVLRHAQAVTTISAWHQQLLSHYNPNTHLIYNGFDAEAFVPTDVPTDTFRISYAGKVYNTRFRDPRLAMQAVGELIAAGTLPQDKIEMVFHIDAGSMNEMQALAEQYKVSPVCRIEGYISPNEMKALLRESSILLVLTCLSTPEGAHGIMGTKFYEALGVEKPVLCVRSDEECLADAIRLTEAGLAASDVEQAKRFITDKYNEWRKNGFTRQAVNQTEKTRFTRQYEAAQFEQIISRIIDGNQP